MTSAEPSISVKEAIGDYYASFVGLVLPQDSLEALALLLNTGTSGLSQYQGHLLADILRYLITANEGSRYDPVNLLAYWRLQLEEGNTPH